MKLKISDCLETLSAQKEHGSHINSSTFSTELKVSKFPAHHVLKITLSNKTVLKMGGQTGQVGSYTLWNQLHSRNTGVSKLEVELKLWDKVRAALYLYPVHLSFTISSSHRMYILYFLFLSFHLFFLKPDLICAIYKNHNWKMHVCHFLIQTSHDWRIFHFYFMLSRVNVPSY